MPEAATKRAIARMDGPAILVGHSWGGTVINMSALPLNAQNQPVLSTAVVRPERNTTYEGGVKADLFDRRLRLNLAAYYTEVRDFQATLVDSTQTVALRGYLSNVPKVTVKGFEADAIAAPIAAPPAAALPVAAPKV